MLLFDFNKVYIFLVHNVVFVVLTEHVVMLTVYSSMPYICFVFVFVNLGFKSVTVLDIFTEHPGARITHLYSDNNVLSGRAVGVGFLSEATDLSIL